MGDLDGLVAITSPEAPLTTITKRKGHVAIEWGGIVIIGVYFSPNRCLAEFEDYLAEIGTLIRQIHPRSVLVIGDLNAKSRLWGSPATDPRGEVLEDWMTMTGLLILNQGSINTCVRRYGGSIVDVSFASHATARRIQGWKILEDAETLSTYPIFQSPLMPVRPGGIRFRGQQKGGPRKDSIKMHWWRHPLSKHG